MEYLGYDFRAALQATASVLLLLAAWRWGAGPERSLALILGWFQVADPINHALFGSAVDLDSLNLGHVVIDAAALVAAVSIALFANRMYPLWFAAFQIVAALAHIARQTPGVAPLAYGVMYIGPSYFQIVILACGIWWHRRRVDRHGPYRAWRNFSRPSPGIARPGSRTG